MNRISGRVILKETGTGIPELLVVVYDLDPGTKPEEMFSGTVVIHGAVTVIPADFPGDRLGSVLTGLSGEFELCYEDDELRVRNDLEKRPDLLVMVMAPQETGKTYSDLLLYSDANVRCNAGRQEQYLIRLAAAQLEQAGIPLPR